MAETLYDKVVALRRIHQAKMDDQAEKIYVTATGPRTGIIGPEDLFLWDILGVMLDIAAKVDNG
ncbi:MAG TPA: hypothetical protein VH164_05325 [Ktedonobacteraceae bacterium]|jgi:hypothetical protein|nr:hypothetical protein [Ktedonobacteraceae bacterium]